MNSHWDDGGDDDFFGGLFLFPSLQCTENREQSPCYMLPSYGRIQNVEARSIDSMANCLLLSAKSRSGRSSPLELNLL
eukprot:scaffold961_cov122-Cylindrotheca_fusiformis.AAC.25